MQAFEIPGKHKAVLGMIHLQPLPGTPFYEENSFNRILDLAVQSARALANGGADGCLIQTVDRVYSVKDESDPARLAAMALVAQAVVQSTGREFQVGVQLMRNALKSSLAVAKVAGGTFIRAGAVVGMTLTTHGMVEANPLETMEYRHKINAWDIKIIADVDSMHFKWFNGARSTAEVAKMAKQVGADAVAFGDPNESQTLAMIASVRQAVPGLPIILAGYTNHENAARLMAEADGAFVGTCLESKGWGGQIDSERVKEFVDIVRGLE